MVLDVKQLYRKIIEDPDVVVDNDTSKEELALDMATQRAIQHERNIEANNLGSPISKLLQFLQKAVNNDELNKLRNLSFLELNLLSRKPGHPSIDEEDLNLRRNEFQNPRVKEQHIQSLYRRLVETGQIKEEGVPSTSTESSQTSGSTGGTGEGPSDAEIEEASEGIGAENEPVVFGGGNQGTDSTEVDEPVVEEAERVEEDEGDADEDTSHIFHHSGYNDKHKEHIKHIHEVDEEHDGLYSNALQKLKTDGENPRVGKPATAVFRTTGPHKGSVNIKYARMWFKQQGGDLALHESKLSIPPTEELSGTSSKETWADKVYALLSEQKGWEFSASADEKTTVGPKLKAFEQEVDRIHKLMRETEGAGYTESQVSQREDDITNQLLESAAKDEKIDISKIGERPKLKDIKTTPGMRTAKKTIGVHRAASKSGPEATAAGQQINEAHKEVIRDIATDDSLTDDEREDKHNEAQTGMQAALAAMGIGNDTSSEVDTSQSSEEAVGEHTGRKVDPIADKEYLSTGVETTQAAHIASDGEKSFRIHRPDPKHTPRANTKWGIWVQEKPGAGWKEDGGFPSYNTKKAVRENFVSDYTSPERERYGLVVGDASNLTNLHPEIEKQREAATQRDKERQENRAAEARDKAMLEERDTAREAKPTLHQSGDSTNLIGNNSTIEHAATSEDGTHHELHLHEDGSATTRRVNTETGETKHTHYHKFADGSGGLKEALEAHNEALTEGGLDEHADLSEEAKKANDPLTTTQLIARHATSDLGTAMKREKQGFGQGTRQEWEDGLADADKASMEPAQAKQAAEDEATAEKRFSDYFGGKTTEGASETADAGAEETTPPITGTRRPGEAQYGFRGMPSSKAGVKRGQGKPTTPEDTDTSTDAEPTEGQATLPGFGEEEEEPASTIQSVLDSLNTSTSSETEETERDKVAQTIGAVKGKDGQYRFKTGAAKEGGMPRKGSKPRYRQMPTKEGEEGKRMAAPTPIGEPEEEETPSPKRSEGQLDMLEEQERGKTVSTERTQSEVGDEAKSALLDSAERAGIFSYLSDTKPFSHSSPQRAREKLAELDIDKLETTLDGHHDKARKHMLSKEPEEAPVVENREELLNRLAKVKGTTNDEAFAEDHKHDTNDELKSAHKKLRDSNETTEKNVARQTEATRVKEAKAFALAEAKRKVSTIKELGAGTSQTDAQQRTREIMNISHNHGHILDEKSQKRLTELVANAAEHGADLDQMIDESKEQALKGGFHDDWLAEKDARRNQDHDEHKEYMRHMTGTKGYQERAEAFERSGAEALVDVDKDGKITQSEEHHSGHDEDGKPNSFGDNIMPRILGQTLEQEDAQKAHHDAVQKGDTAAQQSIEEENPHLAGTSKSEAELEQERIDANRPPGPPPTLADGSLAKWNPNTQRWNNPKTLSGIQNGLGDGEVAVMQNGIHAGTADAHLDNPAAGLAGASGHKGNRNPDGSFNNGIVVVSQTGSHAATLHEDGTATAANVGPMGHRQTAAHAMGAAVSGHMDANLGSYLGTMTGTLKNKVVVKNANRAGSHFGNTGLFGSKTHGSKKGMGTRAAARQEAKTRITGFASKVTGLDKFRARKAAQAGMKDELEAGRKAAKAEAAAPPVTPTQKMLYKADKQKPSPSKILLRSGKLSPTSKQAIREQIRNAQLIREMEEVVKQ